MKTLINTMLEYYSNYSKGHILYMSSSKFNHYIFLLNNSLSRSLFTAPVSYHIQHFSLKHVKFHLQNNIQFLQGETARNQRNPQHGAIISLHEDLLGDYNLQSYLSTWPKRFDYNRNRHRQRCFLRHRTVMHWEKHHHFAVFMNVNSEFARLSAPNLFTQVMSLHRKFHGIFVMTKPWLRSSFDCIIRPASLGRWTHNTLTALVIIP